jgi:hypothetical protein
MTTEDAKWLHFGRGLIMIDYPEEAAYLYQRGTGHVRGTGSTCTLAGGHTAVSDTPRPEASSTAAADADADDDDDVVLGPTPDEAYAGQMGLSMRTQYLGWDDWV